MQEKVAPPAPQHLAGLAKAREWLRERHAHVVPKPDEPKRDFNGRLALLITNAVGTMWCAYAFAILALISLPQAVEGGTATLISWIAQTFLQLVLLSIIMVGQKVAADASDRQAYQTYKDAEALLHISDQLEQLITINNQLTQDIHDTVGAKRRDKDARPA